MKITIEGDPKEIAALALAVQERQVSTRQNYKSFCAEDDKSEEQKTAHEPEARERRKRNIVKTKAYYDAIEILFHPMSYHEVVEILKHAFSLSPNEGSGCQ